MKKQIIAIGGGSFSTDLAIEQYFIQQTGKARPKICLIPTASGDAQETIDNFTDAFHSLGCRTAALSLFRPQTTSFREFLSHHDGIFVSGGNALALHALWQTFGVTNALKECIDAGIVVAATGAGANIFFDQAFAKSALTKSSANSLHQGLGLLTGKFCADYDQHQTEFDIDSGTYLGLPSGSAAHFIDGQLSQLLTTGQCKVTPASSSKTKVTQLAAVDHRIHAPERAFSGVRWESEISYCRILRKGNHIFVTGTTATEDDGKVYAPFEYYKQTKRCLEIIVENLHKVGATTKHVTRTRMFVTNIAEWREYGRAHKEFFADSPPATTMVEVSSLISPGMVVEIEADALI